MSHPTVDPIKAEVVARHLIATSEEMSATLMRTAFSPNIKERADCSTAIFDAQGQVVALAQRVPVHLGSMVGVVEALRERFTPADMQPGDMFAANDPYHGGGSHLPDITVIAPVFMGAEIVAYVANIAHHADVGGMVPGSEAAVCQTIFQEGIRIPLVRIVRAEGVNRDVLDLILLNSRTPEERRGDLQAQFAANHVGIQGVHSLFERYGAAETTAHIAAYLDFTERRFRAAIAQLPFGTYVDADAIDGDVEGSTVAIQLAMTVGDERLHFDFNGSGPELKTARNIPYRALLATIYTVAKSMLDPDVPANAGYYRTITVDIPPGTVVGPVPPAAVGARSLSCGVLGDVIAGCLSQAMPEKALARSGPHHLLILSGTDPRSQTYFVNYETVAGGMGARAHSDGMDAVRVHASGASNLPVEALEHAYPLRIERYALRDLSAGTGQYRGGMGVVRDYRILADDIEVSLSSERQNVPARGECGGMAGAPGEFVLNPDQPGERQLPSAVADVPLPRGSVLSIRTPAGGGYGPVEKRGAVISERPPG
ncbi:hydantoinase B/oxoprolinase family protein [Candidatus Entotheonella palauensis]|uniref:hydantoinase B/oxoprolinase family protein n=1 Tax=Candidatus Entotheonella palauensis TaxID=93172 RepID=UPI000B7EEE1A|nr:hydantoinase B/oxoprolinase family protein [Candidatus Entotheonella palauensis]